MGRTTIHQVRASRVVSLLTSRLKSALITCRFEGLTREGIPHGKGVMVIGNGAGGGFKRASRGDRQVCCRFSTKAYV